MKVSRLKLHFLLQNEDRTLWEATNTYVEMSPFMSANKIKKPILLIHGEEDNNPGTLTMQVREESPPQLYSYKLSLIDCCSIFKETISPGALL